MAVSSTGGPDRDSFSEINVTPLTDVLLVLLIIFLITGSSITAPAHNISLPVVMTKEKAANTNIVIDVTPAGKTFVGNLEVSSKDLQPYLARLATARRTDRVIVNADRETPYASVVLAMDAARSAGLPNIALATSVDKRVENPQVIETPKVQVKQ